MCGIAGLIEFAAGNASDSRQALERMAKTLAHRGPDESGAWTGETGSGRVGLASRRLRVVDLVTGQQPLTNENGTVRLIANAEIYNAPALRAELTERGHVFTSRTDIEVILHAYEEYGRACLERLEGMFAFALWDGSRRRLLLARDRFGEKPLYYARLPRGLVFASEQKALLVHPEVSRDLDFDSVARYLAYEYVPSPHAIFRAVRKLPPAHFLEIDATGDEIGRYWTPPRPALDGPGFREAADEVRTRLRASVEQRIVCDVPWGTLLSGGVDSSLITALAVRASATPVKTFAIGFEESSYDERRHAAEVAQLLGTEHHEVVLRPADAATLVREVATIFDEPFADASSLPALLLSRLARAQVTVVLSGDGGDELFCGYPTQTAHVAAEIFRRLPTRAQRLIAKAADRLPTSHAYLSFDFALRRFVSDAARPAPERHLRWMGGFSPEVRMRVLTPDAQSAIALPDPYTQAYEALERWGSGTPSDVATFLDLVLYLAEDNLVQVDRASMSTALEVRAPFLDRSLAEYALRLPTNLRRGLWRTKPLLRRAAHGLLPASIIRRPKHGFGVPTGSWLRDGLRSLALELLDPNRLRRQGIFDAACVSGLLDRHLSGTANHRKELWTLLMFQLWADAYLGA
jgi:asparagine synthase (glutamine-hydrolysing)